MVLCWDFLVSGIVSGFLKNNGNMHLYCITPSWGKIWYPREKNGIFTPKIKKFMPAVYFPAVRVNWFSVHLQRQSLGLNQRSLRNWPPDCQILTTDWLVHTSKWGLGTSLHSAFLPILWANFSTRCGDFKVPVLRSKSQRSSSSHRHKWGAFEVLYHLCMSNERLFYTEKCSW